MANGTGTHQPKSSSGRPKPPVRPASDLSPADTRKRLLAGRAGECPSVDTCPRQNCRCTASRAKQCPHYRSGIDTDYE